MDRHLSWGPRHSNHNPLGSILRFGFFDLDPAQKPKNQYFNICFFLRIALTDSHCMCSYDNQKLKDIRMACITVSWPSAGQKYVWHIYTLVKKKFYLIFFLLVQKFVDLVKEMKLNSCGAFVSKTWKPLL